MFIWLERILEWVVYLHKIMNKLKSNIISKMGGSQLIGNATAIEVVVVVAGLVQNLEEFAALLQLIGF